MSRFQLIFTGALVLLGVAGAILFAVAKNSSSNSVPHVVMWGTLPDSAVSGFISKVTLDYKDSINVEYVEKNAATFESELISTLAKGFGPDMILLPQDLIAKQLDKFYVVPYGNYSERTFKDSFIQEAELYTIAPTDDLPGGIIGFPFSVDPIVMYWNRDMFSNAGLAGPPTSWTQFFNLVPKFFTKDTNGNITQTLAAFGATKNISHAKDVLALLAMQAGTPIVTRNSYGQFQSVLDKKGDNINPAEQALGFFTEFSNPIKTAYSWNKSLANDRNYFIGGKLALYFGYASELQGLRSANPNLNFDVAVMPQAELGTNNPTANKMTFGKMNAIAILKSSKNIGAAFSTATILTSNPLQQSWVAISGFPPIRRDMLMTLPGDAYKSVFYQSALMSRAWLDPNNIGTNDIFARMVENVTSGKLRISESVRAASLEIDNLLRTNI